MTLATFLVAVLCGMGVGSGGLYIVYLTLFSGYGQLEAQGLNLHFFIFATAAALIIHSFNSPLPFRRIAFICVVGAVGCYFGASLAQRIDKDMLRTIFAWVLILSGFTSLLTKKKNFEKTLYK